jgi:hypothetical protein
LVALHVTYSGYDSRGHAYGKVDGESDLAFTYDEAERVTAIAEGSSPFRPPASITATQGATIHWTTGTFRYGGAANAPRSGRSALRPVGAPAILAGRSR